MAVLILPVAALVAALVEAALVATLVERGLVALVASLSEGLATLVSTLVSSLSLLGLAVLEVTLGLVAEGLAAVGLAVLGLLEVRLDVLLGSSSGLSLLFLILILLVLEVIIKIFIVLKLVLVELLVLEILIIVLNLRGLLSESLSGLGSSLSLLLGRLGLLLGRLGLLEGGGHLGLDSSLGSSLGGSGSGGLLDDLFLGLLVIFNRLEFLANGELSLVGLEEAGDVEDSVALDDEGGLIEEGDENVDGELGLVLGEAGNEELLVVLLDVEGGSLFGGRGQHDIGQRKHFALRLVGLISAELESLVVGENLSEEHFDC